jgi:hypothetical protein
MKGQLVPAWRLAVCCSTDNHGNFYSLWKFLAIMAAKNFQDHALACSDAGRAGAGLADAGRDQRKLTGKPVPDASQRTRAGFRARATRYLGTYG